MDVLTQDQATMPLVRVSHIAGKSEQHCQALSRGVRQALVEAFGIVPNDYFQIITEHAASIDLVGPTHACRLMAVTALPELPFQASERSYVRTRRNVDFGASR